jgi:hypothetical protein
MMDDPFASLGLDQQLFQDEDRPKPEHANKPTRRQADASTRQQETASLSQQDEKHPPKPPAKEGGTGAAKRTASPPDKRPSIKADGPRIRHASAVPSNEAMRSTLAPLTGQIVRTRLTARHTYDIYLDQVRWLNRVKLDLEDEYGVKATNNDMVALAIDMLRWDFEKKGEASKLVRSLILGERAALEESDDG